MRFKEQRAIRRRRKKQGQNYTRLFLKGRPGKKEFLVNISLAFKIFLVLKIYHWFIVIIINIIAINVNLLIFIFIIVVIIIWLLYHHRHYHHHYHYYYYYFIVILTIIILVWRICIFHHNQSSNFYVLLKHLHFSAEQLSFLNPCIFPTFSFSILTIRVVPWGTIITWQLFDTILAFYLKTFCYAENVQCSSSSSSSSSSSWLQLLFSLLLSLNIDIFCFASGDNWEFA